MNTEDEAQVKVGDELAFLGGYGRGQWSIHEVKRITPSGRIVCGPHTLNPDLTVRGQRGSYGAPFRGQRVTGEIRAKVTRQDAVSFLARCSMDELSTPTLLKIIEAVEADSE